MQQNYNKRYNIYERVNYPYVENRDYIQQHLKQNNFELK